MATATVKAKTTTATDVVKWCANNLGIDYDDDEHTPAWRRVSVEAGKLNALVKRSGGVSLDDLMATAKWCAHHRVQVTSPCGLIYHVERASKDLVPDVAETAVDSGLGDAILLEMERREAGDPDAAAWVGRLQRSIGPYREQALAEWQAARGG